MADYKVTCVTKPDRYSAHEHITRLGGVRPDGGRWEDSVENVIRIIESGHHRFYTANCNQIAYLVVRKSASGRKYVQTKADGSFCNNLLSLDECALA